MQSSPRVSRTIQLIGRIAAAGALAVSASIALAWFSQTPSLLLHFYAGPPMVLSAAVTNFVIGVILLWQDWLTPRVRAATSRAIGISVTAVGVLSLLEILASHNLGLDFPSLHTAVQAGNPQPGRVSPYTCAAFLLMGTSLFALGSHHVKRMRLLGVASALALGAIGFGGLLAYALGVQYLHLWPHQTGMATTTAFVFALYSVTLAAQWWSQAASAASRLSSAQKIELLAVGVLSVVSVFVGIVGLATMQRQTQANQERVIAVILDQLQYHIDADLERHLWRAQSIGNDFSSSLEKQTRIGDRFAQVAAVWLDHGIDCVQYSSRMDGQHVSMGRCVGDSAMAMEMQPSLRSRILLVNDGYVLLSTIPVRRDGRLLGYLRVQQALPELSDVLSPNGVWPGESVRACGAVGDSVRCFGPFPGAHSQSLKTASTTAGALTHRRSEVVDADAKDGPVLKQYVPIGQTGLDLEFSVPTVMLYAPARVAMQFMSAFLFVAVALGAWVLYRGLRPLTHQLELARNEAAGNLDLFRSASDASQDGIMLLRAVRDEGNGIMDFDIVYANMSAVGTLGMRRSDVVGRRFLELPGTHAGTSELFARFVAVTESGLASGLESPCFASPDASKWMSRYITKVHDGVMVVSRDITDSRHKAMHLTEQAFLDALTGVPNQRAAMERLSIACNVAKEQGTSVAIAYCDLDAFKSVNDQYGHACGDELLVRFARTLQTAVRHTDIVTRLHGDEFVVLLEDVGTVEEARRVVDGIRAQLDRPVDICSRTVELSASVGLGFATGQDASPHLLLEMADSDMYREKQRRKSLHMGNVPTGP